MVLNAKKINIATVYKHLSMKKTLIIAIAVLLGAAAVASAQPKAIGLRLGYPANEVSYEHYLGGPNFLEAEIGVRDFGQGYSVTGIYNFVFAEPQWTSRGEWAWYAGPGLTAGYVGFKVTDADNNTHKEYHFLAGLVAQVGLEYTFWFPLQLSVDLRPVIGYCDGFYREGALFGMVPQLSVRYHF